MSPEADIVIKLVLGIIGAGSGIITWFARNSFEDMKLALKELTEAVHRMETKAERSDERISQLERRVSALENEVRQIREG